MRLKQLAADFEDHLNVDDVDDECDEENVLEDFVTYVQEDMESP